ncbi:MAG: DNRLRE domain-containing protein [bacterium]|nr:DNRLRE domain-containing protein [bacterium]
MNPRQNFYSSVFEQIMNYKKEREFETNSNFLFDPVVGLGLFASVLLIGVFGGYLKLPNLINNSNLIGSSPIIKIEERAAADIFSPDVSDASENVVSDTSNALVLIPTEDGYVSADAPQKTYGSESYLKVDRSSQKMAYLKFKIPADKPFSKVLLRLYPTDSNNIGGDLSLLNDNLWSDKLLTFDSKPSGGEVRIGPIGPVSARILKTIDVTTYIKNGSTYTFKITSEGTEGIDYSSRESSSETSPALLLVQ